LRRRLGAGELGFGGADEQFGIRIVEQPVRALRFAGADERHAQRGDRYSGQ
jgi:hypothetical protein